MSHMGELLLPEMFVLGELRLHRLAHLGELLVVSISNEPPPTPPFFILLYTFVSLWLLQSFLCLLLYWREDLQPAEALSFNLDR
jgi:hypothetical protein